MPFIVVTTKRDQKRITKGKRLPLAKPVKTQAEPKLEVRPFVLSPSSRLYTEPAESGEQGTGVEPVYPEDQNYRPERNEEYDPDQGSKDLMTRNLSQESKGQSGFLYRYQPEALIESVKPKRALLSRESQKQRFINACRASKNHWIWQKTQDSVSPLFSVDGKPTPLRRAAWLLFKGDISEGMEPINTCHKYRCVNPDCLSLVPRLTAKRTYRVTEADIKEAQRLISLGNSYKSVCEIMGKLDPHTVWKIDRGLLWADNKSSSAGLELLK